MSTNNDEIPLGNENDAIYGSKSTVSRVVKGKSVTEPKSLSSRSLFQFPQHEVTRSIKCTTPLPPRWNASPSPFYQTSLTISAIIYTPMWRDTLVGVKRFAQENSIMILSGHDFKSFIICK